MPAIEVFSLALKYLADKLIKFILDRKGYGVIDPSSIQWVLTVPAIWKPGARQFMRKAAYKVMLILLSFDVGKSRSGLLYFLLHNEHHS